MVHIINKKGILLLVTIFYFVFACDKSNNSSSSGQEGATSGSSGSHVIVQGKLSLEEIEASVKGDNLSLKNREITVTDSTEKTVAKSFTGNDGSYVITIPAALAIDPDLSGSAGGMLTNTPSLNIQSIITDTADESVIGFKKFLDPSLGNFQALGVNKLEKITAIRGNIFLDGAKDHSGIVVYIPGTSFDARTDVTGNFLITFISSGNYDLRIERDGYLPISLTNISVTENLTTRIESQTLILSGGTSQFSVKQVGTEGYSASRIVDFIISSGNADRFKAGLVDTIDTAPYGKIVDAFQYEFLEDGEFTLKFMFANADGFESTAIRTIVIDTVAPSALELRLADRSSLSSTHANEKRVIVYHSSCYDVDKVAVLAATDDREPADDEYIYPCRTFADDSNANFNLPDGVTTFNYKLWAKDKVGNRSPTSASSSIIFDNVPPSPPVGIVSDQTSNSTSGTDITTVGIGFSNCTDTAKVIFSESQTTPPLPGAFTQNCVVGNNTYNYTFYTNQPGSKTVYFWSMDYAGNISTTASSTSIILDQTAPVAPSFTLADPDSAETGFSNNASALATIAHCNDTAQVLISETQTTKPTEMTSGWQDCGTTGVSVPLNNTGNLTFYLWAKDIGGNISSTATTTSLNVDYTPPLASNYTITLSDITSSSATHTNNQTIGFSFENCSSENVSIYLAETPSTPSEADFTTECIAGTGSVSGTFSLGSVTNGNRTLYVWVKDIAGNISVSYLTANIILDTINPDLPGSFTLLDSDTDAINTTNSTTMNFAVDACPSGDFIFIKEDQTSAPTESDAAWQPCVLSGSASNVVTSGNGLKTAYLWKKDAAGNIAGSLNYQTTWDGDPPGSPTILAPASYTTYTQSSAISVSGTAEINATIKITGGLSLTNISVDGSGNYSGSVDLNANSYNGLNFVAQDAAGNNSSPTFIEVYHDTVAPIISNVQLLLTHSTAKITWSTNESADTYLEWGTSASYGTVIAVDDVYGSGSFSYTHSVTLSSLTGNTLYYFKIIATDRAANTASGNDYASSFRSYIEKSGTIASETWNATDTAYYVSNNITVSAGETLQIDPGVTVRMAPGKRIIIQGELNARGTSGNPITITPNALNPSTSDYWDALVFDSGSVAPVMSGDNWSDGNVLEYVNLDRGGNNTTYSYSMIYAITGVAVLNCTFSYANYTNWATFITAMGNATIYLNNSSFTNYHSYVTYGALHVTSSGSGGSFTVKNNNFTSPGGSGMQVHLWIDGSPSALVISNNYFSGCTGLNSSNTRSNIMFGSSAAVSGGTSIVDNIFTSGNMYCGGISLNGSATIERNIFLGLGYRPAISYNPLGSNRTLTLQKNIFINNKPAISALYWSSSSNITYNINNNIFSENDSTSRLPTSGSYGDGPGSVFNIAKASAGYTIGAYAANFNHNLFYKNKGSSSYQSLINMFQDASNEATYTLNNNNFIANSSYYYLYGLIPSPGTVPNAQFNWWGTTISATIAGKLFDGIDDNTYRTVDVSNELSAEDTTAPISPPSGLSASDNGGGSVTLSWSANSETDLSGYKIYYDTNSGFPYQGTGATEGASGIDVGNQTTYTLTGLTPSQTYYFSVTAFDTSTDSVNDLFDGNESWFSSESALYLSP